MSTSSQPQQIKLLVNSASEAVSVIRERYGEMARVLSVKQVEASGLKRLVSKPRLEVIVEIPAAPQSAPAAPPAETKREAPAPVEPVQASTQNADTLGSEDETLAPKSPIGSLYAKGKTQLQNGSDYFSQFEEAEEKPKPSKVIEEEAPLGSAANPVRRGTLEAVQRAISMLESVGFDRTLIERVRGEIDFRDIGSLPTMDLYAKICNWLRNQFPDTKHDLLGERRAFIGCSGVGKTSALSKMLSSETFLSGLAPSVLKVDLDLPNPSDGLEVFCEIMGAPLFRSIEEVGTVSREQPLLVDMPGYSLSDSRSLRACGEALDELGIDERILVVNAAYEAELIADMMAAGESIGATRVVFTHLEETRKAGKLWKFLLNGRIRPLFFSEGPNPAGEYTMDTYGYLLERSFPNGRDLAAATKRSKAVSRNQAEEAAAGR